jgi:excinuclease ABC subunit B
MVRYLHSDIDTLARVELIRELRQGKYNVLIGINLLREGLDIPEVSLVAVLDADKEGFLRSERSLVQTCGRAARNAAGMVILYGDKITKSMQYTIDETDRRRAIQDRFNREHGIVPQTVRSTVKDSIAQHLKATGWFDTTAEEEPEAIEAAEPQAAYHSVEDLKAEVNELEKKMHRAAEALEFEEAAEYRDRIKALTEIMLAC